APFGRQALQSFPLLLRRQLPEVLLDEVTPEILHRIRHGKALPLKSLEQLHWTALPGTRRLYSAAPPFRKGAEARRRVRRMAGGRQPLARLQYLRCPFFPPPVKSAACRAWRNRDRGRATGYWRR